MLDTASADSTAERAARIPDIAWSPWNCIEHMFDPQWQHRLRQVPERTEIPHSGGRRERLSGTRPVHCPRALIVSRDTKMPFPPLCAITRFPLREFLP